MTTGSVRIRIGILGAALLLCLCGGLAGDTIIKRDGTIYIGTIQQDSGDWMVIEIDQSGNSVTIPIRKSDIRSIKHVGESDTEPTTATSPSGETFCPLPVRGEIGVDVRAEFLTEAIARARKAKAGFVVLVFDSAGGSADEALKIIDAIKQARGKVRLVAMVERATSCAAAVAMAVPEIYISLTGVIGDATGPGTGADGAKTPMPAGDQKKIRDRGLVEANAVDHPILAARGMTDPSWELSIKTIEGRRRLVAGIGGQVVCVKGQRLVLRGADAVAAGVAKKLAVGPDALYRAIGIDRWRKVAPEAWDGMIDKGKQSRRKHDDDARAGRWDDYRRRMEQRMREIEQNTPQTQPRTREST